MDKDIKKNPLIVILILNWNNFEDTYHCVQSVIETDYNRKVVLIVDNGSNLNDYQKFQENLSHKIYILKNEKNYGFAKGNNIGIKYAMNELNADHLIMLNNDTIVDKSFITNFVKILPELENPGILASKMYYHDVKNKIWYAGGFMNWFGRHGHTGIGSVDTGQFSEVKETFYAPLASCLITGEVLKKGLLLDEDYFLQWEDIEYAIRLRKNGFNTYLVPNSIIWHKVGESTTTTYLTYRKHFHGYRGRILTRKKHLGVFKFFLYLIYTTFYLIPFHSMYFTFVKRDWRFIKSMIGGLFSGIKGGRLDHL